MAEVRDVAPGLWLWRQRHPDWREGLEWEPEVASFVVESEGETILLDPLAPHPREREVWDRLERTPPTVAVVLKPDHVRDVDLFARWFGARAFGPDLFFAGDAPKTKLELVLPGDELPGGLRALYDGRLRVETPLTASRVSVRAAGAPRAGTASARSGRGRPPARPGLPR